MKRVVRSLWATGASLALGVAATGCDSETEDLLPREAIQGKVTIDGEPLTRGAIRFRTASPGGSAIEVGELIRDGEYKIPRVQGPVPGTYSVSITEEVDGKPEAGDLFGSREKMKKSRIPVKYNLKSALKAEVKKDQAEPLDFALTTK